MIPKIWHRARCNNCETEIWCKRLETEPLRYKSMLCPVCPDPDVISFEEQFRALDGEEPPSMRGREIIDAAVTAANALVEMRNLMLAHLT